MTFQPALDLLATLPAETRRAPLFIARAPGRLDVMGGIADYSGARVLQLPLACATFALVQPLNSSRCEISSRRGNGDRWDHFGIDLPLAPARELARRFRAHTANRWAGYIVGVVQALLARGGTTKGLKIWIASTVPEGRGVASSAALEVSVATAVAAACDISIDAPELAALCQRVENEVVGAPCGIMDQMTSACGKHDRLLQLRCQPGTIEGYIEIPSGLRFYGIDSGVSHAVSGADYTTVRTAAFMGARILAVDAGWGGRYLADLTPAQFAQVARVLPEAISGAEFLERYGSISDTATTVLPALQYPVRRAAQHPVGEQQRVDRFGVLLRELSHRPDAATELGQLMYASHESYGACGLGSDATDRLVELVRKAGPERGLFGAKITGGGSGGTVAVLGTVEAESSVREIAAQNRVFMESGPGAADSGVLRRP